ncbi:unnamed protein product [Cuscuta epithymum]|uniref:Uncharacterized protein n=1 Tax=Cuscuta epithymum TaxID=186058 RepID=A0AAV0F1I8_9ASTE|nr:unnamed protein product [Cuscuta epithymum]
MRNKPFLHYDELVEVFKNVRSTRVRAKNAADAIEDKMDKNEMMKLISEGHMEKIK